MYALKHRHVGYASLSTKKFKTETSIDQLYGIQYREAIVRENIEAWLELVGLYEHGFIEESMWHDILVALYRFARPWNIERDEYYLEARERGRHVTLRNFLTHVRALVVR